MASYWLGVLPRARRELSRWRSLAGRIPDPTLRELALATHREEGLNSEGAAAFATLVPRSHREDAIRLLVALQVMYDYLDTLGEQAVDDPFENGLLLHRAYMAAWDSRTPALDYYEHFPSGGDNGYLDRLVASCQESASRLPSTPAVAAIAARAAGRCAEGQSHLHAGMRDGTDRLQQWSLLQRPMEDHAWWEIAAGSVSSILVHALAAAAGDPRTSADDAAAIDAAYFPSVCALATLLESLVDYEEDVATGNLSLVAQYGSSLAAAERLGTLAERADRGVRRLRRGRQHAVVLSGLASFYLSAPGAREPYAQPVGAAVAHSFGPRLAPLVTAMRLRRHAGRNAHSDRPSPRRPRATA